MATKEFAVCIPFRSDNGGVRDDLMRFTVKWWRKNVPEAQVILGDSLIDAVPGQFCRAWAINYAVAMAGDLADEVVLISDADTITLDPESIRHAVLTVRNRMILCYPHEIRWMLGREDTAALMSRGMWNTGDLETTGPHYNTYSGVIACGRPLWDAVNGFDFRFEGWGFEDLAFMYACGTLGELTRTPRAEHVHLWHPRKQEEEDGQPHYIDNWNVWTKYKNANGDPVAMRGVIEEGWQ
jgi:hypothetical protein